MTVCRDSKQRCPSEQCKAGAESTKESLLACLASLDGQPKAAVPTWSCRGLVSGYVAGRTRVAIPRTGHQRCEAEGEIVSAAGGIDANLLRREEFLGCTKQINDQ